MPPRCAAQFALSPEGERRARAFLTTAGMVEGGQGENQREGERKGEMRKGGKGVEEGTVGECWSPAPLFLPS